MKKKKTLALAAAAALACCCVAGGSLAWLLDRTEPLDNVFTVGHVAIELERSPPGTSPALRTTGLASLRMGTMRRCGTGWLRSTRPARAR